MFRYSQYGPYICIAAVLSVLFILWAFWGGQNYEFVGLAPLAPDTCGSYTGSVYNWGNITPATGYDPVIGQDCVPSDGACMRDASDASAEPNIVVDNTPAIPVQFTVIKETQDDHPICPQVPEIIKPREHTQESNEIHNMFNNPLMPHLPLHNLPQIGNPTIMNAPLPNNTRGRGRFISRGERTCCQTMQRIYGVPFVSTWPDWLRNPETGEKLELDCYNEELQLAVEYNGEQHYKWPNFTNQTYQQFLNQVRRDTLKLDLCDRNGVYLIVVPYNVPHDNIPAYIMSHLPETIQKRLQEERTLSSIS